MSKIELDKAYDAKLVEDYIYQKWEDSGYFNPDNLPGDRKESFTISMPPPNVTGILHLGHAFENAIMDIAVRYQRMRGKRALIVPGTDHAAVATQARVESDLKKQGLKNPRQELGREELVKKIREFAEDHKSIIIGQIKKMGTSCDWSRLAYTFDEPRSQAVNEIFRRMFADSLIYRGYRVINWSVKGQSTCSDDELEHETRKTTVYTFKYSESFPIPIATTRPETKLGDTAVAVNPEDERYRHFIGQKFTVDVGAQNPLVITIIGDKNVDPNYGTGAVGVTPAHSQIDFEMYQNNKEIGIIPVIGKDGLMLPAAGQDYAGLTVLEAREKFVSWLKDNNLYISEEEIEHNVGTSDRFGDVVEALPMDQWFVDVNKKIPGRDKTLKDLMREAVTSGHNGKKEKIITINPERYHNIYLHWIDNLRDWCISRQIWWGHRIPIWYCDECNDVFYSDTKLEACPKCQSTKFRQDEDTLDTWFSSGAWTFSTLGWPAHNATPSVAGGPAHNATPARKATLNVAGGPSVAGGPNDSEDLKKFHPNEWMQMGYEILFFWMARMILMTTYTLDDIPFKEVYIHGMLRAKDGRKFSKSLGNGLDPLEVIEKYGTDALRLSLIKGVTAGNDSRFYEEKVEGSRNFVNKLWNISRYIFSSSTSFEIISEKPQTKTLADEWILGRLNYTAVVSGEYLEKADFSGAVETLIEFTRDDFADWYLEISKIESDKEQILLYVLQNLLKLWHPFIPYVTENIWSKFDNAGILMVETWPEISNIKKSGLVSKVKGALHLTTTEEVAEFDLIKQTITALRNLRSENKVDAGKWVKATIITTDKKELLESQKEVLMKLARLETLEILETGEKPKGSAVAVISGLEIYLDLAGLIDVAAEKERLNKELEVVEKYAKSLDLKLSNAEFVSNAPTAVVDKEKEKLAEAREKLGKLKAQLESLG
jgi:valyl-tRNA synthetase